MKKEVLIIIPAYNEEISIRTTLQSLQSPELTEIADILVINDASSDNTGAIARELGVPVITHVFNLGYGSALQIGYKYAVRNQYQYVIQMDSDGQHDACNVLPIYKALQTADAEGVCPDIVIGSRFLEGSRTFPISWMKKLAILYFRKLIRLLTKQNITDPTSGLQGLDRKAFLYYSQYNHFDAAYPDANMLIQMGLLGYQIREIPAVMHARVSGTSMHSGILKPAAYMVIMSMNIFHIWIRCRHKKESPVSGQTDTDYNNAKK